MTRLVLSLLACLSVASVNIQAAEPAKIELRLLKTVTVTEEQFLLGSQDGLPVTLAVELRLPTAGAARLPAMILLHGSGGIQAGNDRWTKELNGDMSTLGGLSRVIMDSGSDE